MKIGVVGSGNMGRSLGILLALHGHEVFFGARRFEQAEHARSLAGDDAHAGTNQEAATFGEVIVWAVRGAPAAEIVADLSVLANKPVIDLNNASPQSPETLEVRLSAGETLQREMPQARIVKAFNSLPQELFEVPTDVLRERQVSVFLASDDADAKAMVRGLVEQLGFAPIDCGKLDASGPLERLRDVFRLAIRNGGSMWSALSIVPVPEPTAKRLGGRLISQLR